MTTPAFESSWRERTMRAIDLGMMVVALAAFVSLVLEYGFFLGPNLTGVLQKLDVVIISLFVMDLLVKLVLSRPRLTYLREHVVQYSLLAVLVVGLALAHRLPRYPAIDQLLDALNIPSVAKLYIVIIQIAIAVRLVFEAVDLQRKLGSKRFRPTHILVAGYVAIILVGTFLLQSPRATPGGAPRTAFVDSLFTATSATCVTGLVVQNTGSHFSSFGQGVILVLIQIGGLGLMTFTAFFAIVFGLGMNAKDRMVMQDVLNERTMGTVGRTVVYILVLTFMLEALGAALLYPVWQGEMSTGQRVYTSVFHSVSSFCNAGFSLYDTSFTAYRGSWALNGVVCGLIVLGGLGFVVHRNLLEMVRNLWHRLHMPFSRRDLFEPAPRARLTLHSRIVLVTTVCLIVGGALVIWLMERNGAFASMSPREQFLASTFQSVTPRTAGFNTVDVSKLNGGTQIFVMFLMFVGASPGSTGGGIKTVAFALLIIAVISSLRKRESLDIFRRGLPRATLHHAVVVAVVAFLVIVTSAVLLCFLERNNTAVDVDQALFEVVSAFATVGLSTGITPALTTGGKIVIIFTMLVGRIGPLTLVLAMGQRMARASYEYPEEDVMIG